MDDKATTTKDGYHGEKRSTRNATRATHLTFDSFDEPLKLHFDTASIERTSAKGKALLWGSI